MKLNNFLSDKRVRNAPDAPAPNPNPSAEPTPTADPAPPPVPSSDAGPDLSFIPSDYHVEGKPDLGKFNEHYQDLVARDAQYSERLAEVPEDGVYDYALPEDFTFGDMDLPEGFTVQLSDDPDIQPLLGELGEFLKDLGAPKAAGQKIAGLIARYEAAKISKGFAAHKAEMASLGTPAQQDARIESIRRVMAARLPAEQVKALEAATTSAKGIQALEALLKPRSPQVPPTVPNGADAENLSAYDRLKLANTQARA